MPRQDLIQVRRGTAAQWTSANPTLDSGEFGFETDTNKLKCGDGSTDWNSLSYISGATTGLESINEGNGTGWRLIGRDPANYGNIGLNAVDLSTSTSPSTTRGTTGGYSFAEGSNNVSSGDYSHAEGIGNDASGFASHVEGSKNEASGDVSHAEGSDNIASGFASHAEGQGNFARSIGEHSGGQYGTDYTPADDATDRLVNYGNGTSSIARSDAFTIFKNGAIRIFRSNLASITNAASGFLIFDSGNNNRPTAHNGTQWNALAYESDLKEQNIIGSRVDATVSGAYDIDLNNGSVFKLTMTGNTVFSFSNLPTGTDVKAFTVILTGDFVPTLPAYCELTPSSDTYDGTVRNRLIFDVIEGTTSSEDVIVTQENLAS